MRKHSMKQFILEVVMITESHVGRPLIVMRPGTYESKGRHGPNNVLVLKHRQLQKLRALIAAGLGCYMELGIIKQKY